MLNKHKQSVKKIVYTLTKPLNTVVTQIEDLTMLMKAAKKPYPDIRIVKKAMNIISNPNDFEKGQAN